MVVKSVILDSPVAAYKDNVTSVKGSCFITLISGLNGGRKSGLADVISSYHCETNQLSSSVNLRIEDFKSTVHLSNQHSLPS